MFPTGARGARSGAGGNAQSWKLREVNQHQRRRQAPQTGAGISSHGTNARARSGAWQAQMTGSQGSIHRGVYCNGPRADRYLDVRAQI